MTKRNIIEYKQIVFTMDFFSGCCFSIVNNNEETGFIQLFYFKLQTRLHIIVVEKNESAYNKTALLQLYVSL